MQGAANERVIQYVFMIKLNSRKLQTKIKRSSENGNEQMRLFVLQKALPRLIRDFKTQVKMKRYCSVSGINICYNFLQNRTTIAPPPPPTTPPHDTKKKNPCPPPPPPHPPPGIQYKNPEIFWLI